LRPFALDLFVGARARFRKAASPLVWFSLSRIMQAPYEFG